MTSYNIQEHVHRYAIWTAARAAQRGFTTTENISKAIEKCNLREELEKLDNLNLDQSTFDKFHISTAENLIASLQEIVEEKLSSKVTYGRVAKIIAIYIKTAYVIRKPESPISKIAHPPIDAILLISLPKRNFGNIRWTKLEKDEYFELINSLRKEFELPSFWMLEYYWSPADKEEA